MEFKLPEEWNDWTPLEEIGSGAYGKVYKVRLNRPRFSPEEDEYAAVKFIQISASGDDLAEAKLLYHDQLSLRNHYSKKVQELLAEIKAMILLRDDPHIVRFDDYHLDADPDNLQWNIYIRMELLTPFLKYSREKIPDEQDVIRLGISLCKALEICARRGILHRDIKPQNIMVAKDGTYKLGDFGIAKSFNTKTTITSRTGTYSFMAPEVFYTQPYDTRVDQYSLGLVLYRLMNKNRDPFVDLEKQFITLQDEQKAFCIRMSGMPLPSPVSASPTFAAIITKACAFAPYQRFTRISDMLKALTDISKPSPNPDEKISSKSPPVDNKGRFFYIH